MQGTAPFIAIELLIHSPSHRVVHDLESLLYVLLFICTHLKGPFREIRDPPLYGGKKGTEEHPSSMRYWFDQKSLSNLGIVKFAHMISFFEDQIVSNISPYFDPIKVYIRDFWKALVPEREILASQGRKVVHSTSTPQDVINVFKAALLDDELIKQHNRAHMTGSTSSVLGKRSAPGDLIGLGGWDPETVPKNITKANPKLNPTPKRKAMLMRKR